MACSLTTIIRGSYDGLIYRGLNRTEVFRLDKLYIEMSGTRNLAWHLRVVYWLIGNRMVIVAARRTEHHDQVVGFDMFYFNERDTQEGTIHEGFIGVLPEYRGMGIATNLRRHAINNFRRDIVRGITSRIDSDNIPSLKSAFKVGFQIIEKYYDIVCEKDRYYLVKRFDSSTHDAC